MVLTAPAKRQQNGRALEHLLPSSSVTLWARESYRRRSRRMGVGKDMEIRRGGNATGSCYRPTLESNRVVPGPSVASVAAIRSVPAIGSRRAIVFSSQIRRRTCRGIPLRPRAPVKVAGAVCGGLVGLGGRAVAGLGAANGSTVRGEAKGFLFGTDPFKGVRGRGRGGARDREDTCPAGTRRGAIRPLVLPRSCVGPARREVARVLLTGRTALYASPAGGSCITQGPRNTRAPLPVW